MTLTLMLDPGHRGFVFETGPNGVRPKLIGTADTIDPEEKIQSIEYRLLVQLGELFLYPEVGFDREGIMGQYSDNVDEPDDTEAMIRAKTLRIMAQDEDVVSPLLRLDVEEEIGENPETRTWYVFITFQLVTGQILEAGQRIGVVTREQSFGTI